MDDLHQNEAGSDGRCFESGFTVQTLLIALMLTYVLFPVAIVYPVKKVFGTVPKFIEAVFIPVEWLYNRSKLYRDYIDLQTQIIKP